MILFGNQARFALVSMLYFHHAQVNGTTVYAAVSRPPLGWYGWLTRLGCLFSMVFAVGYGGLMVVVATAPAFADGASETFDLWLLWRAGALAVGFAATWRAWRWLRRRSA